MHVFFAFRDVQAAYPGHTMRVQAYDLESEILIKASRMKFKISSAPIETIYRNELSRIHPVKDTIRFVGLLVKSYFNKRG